MPHPVEFLIVIPDLPSRSILAVLFSLPVSTLWQ
jgi:hypothetical protein